MECRIVKGCEQNYEDIIDFGNYVFGIDFPELLPKLYRDHRETAGYHHLVMEDNKIKAMVGSFPLELKVCSDILKVRGIGTVSVHRYSRGCGYMKLLMDKAVGEMQNEKCDLAILSGQRQRYEYWGFTPGGIKIKMHFNQANVKHCKFEDSHLYNFVSYREAEEADIDVAFNLYHSQAAHAIRPRHNFTDIVCSWNSQMILIYKDNKVCGYLSASQNYEEIREVILFDSDEIDRVLIAFMKHFKPVSVKLSLFMHLSEEFKKLSRICEYYVIDQAANICVFNYRSVIKAFLTLKSHMTALKDGTLILNIDGRGRYRITVDNGNIEVEESSMDYDVNLSHIEATSMLFSPGGFLEVIGSSNTLIKDWFPLPLFISEVDNV